MKRNKLFVDGKLVESVGVNTTNKSSDSNKKRSHSDEIINVNELNNQKKQSLEILKPAIEKVNFKPSTLDHFLRPRANSMDTGSGTYANQRSKNGI